MEWNGSTCCQLFISKVNGGKDSGLSASGWNGLWCPESQQGESIRRSSSKAAFFVNGFRAKGTGLASALLSPPPPVYPGTVAGGEAEQNTPKSVTAVHHWLCVAPPCSFHTGGLGSTINCPAPLCPSSFCYVLLHLDMRL